MSANKYNKIKTIVLILATFLFLVGCSSSDTLVPDYVERYDVAGEPAPLPEGVVAYCWEEPMTEYNRVQPGVDYDGHWYRPAHVEVRQVRGGKWRPCKPKMYRQHSTN